MDAAANAAETGRLLRLATYASVATACLLILAKLIAWLMTGSVSVLASLVDSTMDAGASLVNLLAVRWSLAPPDAEHRFGHGKAQALAALAQAAFIAGSAGFLALEAMDRLLHPRPIAEIGVGVTVIGFAIVVTLGLLAVQRHVIRRTGSPAIRADALHYATDLATNTATLVALGITALGWDGADPLFGLAIGAYIFYSAVRIALEAIQLLMDHELPEPQRQRIAELVRAIPGVLGMHDLRTRQSGQSQIIQFHLELDGQLPLNEAHRIGKAAEAAIQTAYPDSDIIIHQDPIAG
ncbi:cation diffusion facilitator family transporter [Thiorhodococcus mannitoliphagus]|uniref:Cation-efflux pump FieF n=1 Tax=Thiorhodococcus mannitoliphagus TaxID=329406 RepID=A0A6P1E0J0_9GAMM|nr:cation diffusion facilitator family transporter [Thiorhodococcus mannitoliphagus]NEX22556.1 cation diffusion facilitator family transporter [Thiorhodococcus mannitoliphagus]